MWDSSEPPLQDVALVGRRWSSGITLSSGELSTLLLLSNSEMSGPSFKMEDANFLKKNSDSCQLPLEATESTKYLNGLHAEKMESGGGPLGVLKDFCCGVSFTAILNLFLMMFILVALAIISAHNKELKTYQTARTQVCPLPYTMVMGECFYAQNVFTFTFKEAESYCSAMGGHLAEPKTAQRLLSYQVDILGPLKQRQSYWIGGSDPDNDGQFNWLSGRPVDKSEWQQGMPSETHWNKTCLRYYLASHDCGVADAKCTDGMHAICEYPIK